MRCDTPANGNTKGAQLEARTSRFADAGSFVVRRAVPSTFALDSPGTSKRDVCSRTQFEAGLGADAAPSPASAISRKYLACSASGASERTFPRWKYWSFVV